VQSGHASRLAGRLYNKWHRTQDGGCSRCGGCFGVSNMLELLLASRHAGGSVTTATATIATLGRAMA